MQWWRRLGWEGRGRSCWWKGPQQLAPSMLHGGKKTHWQSSYKQFTVPYNAMHCKSVQRNAKTCATTQCNALLLKAAFCRAILHALLALGDKLPACKTAKQGFAKNPQENTTLCLIQANLWTLLHFLLGPLGKKSHITLWILSVKGNPPQLYFEQKTQCLVIFEQQMSVKGGGGYLSGL